MASIELYRRDYLIGPESREYGRRDPTRWSLGTLYAQKFGINLADKQRSFGRYSSLADSDHRVLEVI
jgi:hypothetical protein